MKCLNFTLVFLMSVCSGALIPLTAQKHHAAGDNVIRRNRLISVKSEPGSELYLPRREFRDQDIRADGAMSESAWQDAALIAPFTDGNGNSDQTSVRLLFDAKNIYLYWQVREQGDLTATMEQFDGVITDDDYIQVDLKPWLPDSIKYRRNYYYTIADLQ